uniref:Uncharacterized protein n=1 Tax=Anguilla anguilla TaxID=7936 RepID=A0A0E9UI57_ANGAN
MWSIFPESSRKRTLLNTDLQRRERAARSDLSGLLFL